MAKHEFTRIKQETVRRKLDVVSKELITPRMLRIVFHSDELRGFHSPSADDHIKIFLPRDNTSEPVMRDFTPRAWDLDSGTITLDFALHPQGPAVEWARNAEIGAALQMAGPRGSTIVPDDFDWYLLIGDLTGLPSIGRRLETLRKGVSVYVLALVEDENEKQEFSTSTNCQIHWVKTDHNLQQDSESLLAAVKQLELPTGDGYIWIAAEVSVARELYRYAVDTLKHPKHWVKAAGYWERWEHR